VAAPHFELSVLTPERAVFEGRVEYVQVPGREGYLGVLAGHAALVTELGEGVLTARRGTDDEVRWRVSGGFFQVAENRATVLADTAEELEQEARG